MIISYTTIDYLHIIVLVVVAKFCFSNVKKGMHFVKNRRTILLSLGLMMMDRVKTRNWIFGYILTPKILKMKCNKWPFEQNFYSYFAKYLAFVDFSNFQSAFHQSITVSTQVCQIFAKKLPHKNSFLYIYFQISKPGFFNYPIIYITTLGHF